MFADETQRIFGKSHFLCSFQTVFIYLFHFLSPLVKTALGVPAFYFRNITASNLNPLDFEIFEVKQ